jgi:hypothetical protein
VSVIPQFAGAPNPIGKPRPTWQEQVRQALLVNGMGELD